MGKRKNIKLMGQRLASIIAIVHMKDIVPINKKKTMFRIDALEDRVKVLEQ